MGEVLPGRDGLLALLEALVGGHDGGELGDEVKPLLVEGLPGDVPSVGSSIPSSETAVRRKLMGWAETG